MANEMRRVVLKVMPDGDIRGYVDNACKSGASEAQFASPDGISGAVTATWGAQVWLKEIMGQMTEEDMEYTDRILGEPDGEGWFPVERTFADGTVKRLRKRYRIRKLTPKECFRLMGVSDPEADTMADEGISDTQLYKLAGNSIVVPVLEGIFTQMLRADTNSFF